MEELKIIEQQREFFATGKTFSLEFRLEQLKQLKKMFQENEAVFTSAMKKDLGKHPSETFITEIGLIYHSINFSLKHLPKWLKKQRKKTSLFLQPAKSYTLASPYGNVLIMSAFNYPLLLSMDPLIGAIAGGNTALVALSERTPQVNEAILKVAPQYFSKEYVAFYVSTVENNTAVLKEKFHKIFFTGSPKVGKIVLKAGSEHLTPVTLELGGKSPALVTANGKISLAAEKIAWGKFLNAGQTCVAPDYCLVDKKIAPEFLAELNTQIKKMYGATIKENPDYPRIVQGPSFDHLCQLIEQDKKYLYAGGEGVKKENYLSPTLLSAPLNSSLASMEEEIFGPILPVLTYDTLKEAVAFIKAHPAPLAFYPFSKDKEEVTELLEKISFGGATVNDTILHLANIHLPFGGVGNSGMGHYHGEYSFKTFTHEKAVLDRKTWVNLPIMEAPYTRKKDNLIRKFLS